MGTHEDRIHLERQYDGVHASSSARENALFSAVLVGSVAVLIGGAIVATKVKVHLGRCRDRLMGQQTEMLALLLKYGQSILSDSSRRDVHGWAL